MTQLSIALHISNLPEYPPSFGTVAVTVVLGPGVVAELGLECA